MPTGRDTSFLGFYKGERMYKLSSQECVRLRRLKCMGVIYRTRHPRRDDFGTREGTRIKVGERILPFTC